MRTHRPLVRRILPWVVGLGLLSTGAAQTFATPCLRAETVEASGFATDPASDVALDTAVVAALSNAIAAVRGVEITNETTLVDRYRETVRTEGEGTRVDATSSSRLDTRIETRLAGHVLGYDLLGSGPADGGAVRATVRATVCTDPRIVLSLRSGGVVSPDLLVDSLASRLAPQAERLGWWLIPRHVPGLDLRRGFGLDALWDTGASVVLQGRLAAERLDAEGVAYVYDVSLAYDVVDVVTGAVLASNAAVTVRGAGYTEGAAIQDATDKIGAELGRSLTLALVPEAAVPVATLTFDPVRRSGSRYTIVDRLERLNGVVDVEAAYLENRRLRIDVRLNADACSVAEDLADWTRIRMVVERCGAADAHLRVLRE